MARERDVGIDDLLGAPAEGEAEPQPGTGRPVRSRRWWTALVAAVVSGAAYVVSLPLGLKIPYILLFSGCFALLAVRRAVRAVAAPRMTIGTDRPSPVAARIDPTRVPDGIELALGRWDTRLSESERDPKRFMSIVRPRLAEIADERLRQRHGVSRVDDPARARQLMGERLWTFLFSPLGAVPNPRELADVVEDMEKL
ncbi:hypothetical protein HC031_11090 [Planosporangium thailandense]|uniref:DUF4129 domain-containing protein n=1 Tax=Planosporangium thailandense TaxID=765197 RepID=A0ABX0XW32_9ACTN|nr:hypothetical protein [Planosporangium thailandense]NJC70251.1 hypothetical protein [Planosporangium thailandense]